MSNLDRAIEAAAKKVAEEKETTRRMKKSRKAYSSKGWKLVRREIERRRTGRGNLGPCIVCGEATDFVSPNEKGEPVFLHPRCCKA